MKKTYWTVKVAVMGAGHKNLYFRDYKNAKAESMKDYRDNPIKHTVKSEKFNELEKVGAFED